MKRHRAIWGGVMLACLAIPSVHLRIPAAEPPQGKDQPSTVIKIPVEYVSVLFTVTDKRNHYVTNLKQSDFKVYEDDKPQNVLIFRSETDLPLKIALLVEDPGFYRDALAATEPEKVHGIISRYEQALESREP